MKRAMYREDGMKLAVDILTDDSDDEWARYNLRVVEVFRQSRLHPDVSVGETFSVEQKKNGGCWGGMWSLDEDDPEAQVSL